ncbi:Iota-carrageenase A2 [Echinicola strongylocentroti]|uniref:Iota-carrageenase A2 n=1 Tax=Echinicola strongylocentroti TaxID=1795355 RepID=A0A2Z4IQ35_9BACT|nr:glycosyl hydrolase family 28-related protein [Echinicola strongylocentroti]AWW32880.1 Iota-carrageenase A2 [Echinicola strongylocentroti]
MLKLKNLIPCVLSSLILGSCIVDTPTGMSEIDEYVNRDVGIRVNLVDDYGANGSDEEDDTPFLTQAIAELSSDHDGGTIYIPEGTFHLGQVHLASNIHIEIEGETVIIPVERPDDKNYSVFYMGSNSPVVENVSIVGVNGRFTIDMRAVTNGNIRGFQFNNVDQFYLANFDVLDNLTKFSAVTFGFADYEGNYFYPKNGMVKNGSTFNSAYGYGLVQMQAGQNIKFKNIYGDGGVTLRLETGYKLMNELQIGGLFDIEGKNITCENGNAAVMISPHSIKNGRFDIKNVTAVNCGIGIRLGAGYVAKSQLHLDIEPGTFDSTSTIENVHAVYGETTQLKSKHFEFMPCELRDQVSLVEMPYESKPIHTGPSICPVLNSAYGENPADGDFKIDVKNITAEGFDLLDNWELRREDAIPDCPEDI